MKSLIFFLLIISSLIWLHPINGVSSAVDLSVTIPGGTTQAHYQLISFPVKPEGDQPEYQDPLLNEEILIDDLDPYNPYQWRLFRWDPTAYEGQGAHIELNQREGDIVWTEDQNIDFGRGYWIISRQTKDITISGNLIPDGQNIISLEPGWNQIGNIYDYPFPMDNLKVGPKDGPYVPLISDENIYTSKVIWEWVNGKYQPAINQLEAWKGYWIKNKTKETGPPTFPLEGILVEFEFGIELGPVSNSYDLYSVDLTQEEEPPSPPSAIEDSSSLSFSGSSGSGGGGCFIATAAYGNYDHPSVQILRAFRDRYLSTNSLGRIFVDAYYHYSPALARFSVKHKSIKALTRFNLVPVIGMSTIVSKMNVYAYFAIMASPFLGGFFFLRRRQRVLGRWKVKHSSKSKKGKRKG